MGIVPSKSKRLALFFDKPLRAGGGKWNGLASGRMELQWPTTNGRISGLS